MPADPDKLLQANFRVPPFVAKRFASLLDETKSGKNRAMTAIMSWFNTLSLEERLDVMNGRTPMPRGYAQSHSQSLAPAALTTMLDALAEPLPVDTLARLIDLLSPADRAALVRRLAGPANADGTPRVTDDKPRIEVVERHLVNAPKGPAKRLTRGKDGVVRERGK